MNTIKIMSMLKMKFSQFHDIKKYRVHASEQFVVKRYKLNSRKIIVDKEK
ncbi:hypothetical protein J4206_05665 [Candidatus Woesearchaeota archaeon]|nr:hypothetical protein [Candidatus Woesearchaeota archaeon]